MLPTRVLARSSKQFRGNAHFHRELFPAVRPFLEGEGVIQPSDRPDRNGNIMGDCIAHTSKSHKSCSYKLNGQIYCFGCGFHGDLIDFVKLRYRVDFKTAAKRLGAWRDLPVTPHERRELHCLTAMRQQEREQLLQAEKALRRERLAQRDEIHQDTQLMKDISAQLRQDVENETLWECLELTWKCRELNEQPYLKACGLEVDC
jgi:DNA primase